MTVHILVTGTSRGIGAAIAASLGDRDDVRLVGHATTMADAATIAADLESADGAGALWAEALDRLDGRIDVLVNNAGIFEAAPIGMDETQWLAAWERTIRIDLTAAALLSRLAVLHFREAGGGRIVNVASRAAHRGDSPDHWSYAAAKAGMVAMTKTIARAYAAENILAFAICPGFTMTGMAEDYLASRGGAAILNDIPLGRVAGADEVARAVRFLTLDAPPSMTGGVIDINGASYVR